MPRISKIRLVGCKYDGFKKGHKNSIYDLTKDGEPDHTLFTLKNGGGKGVMMQLIFQIMMPGTRWGKNNGNKITSMFYDHKGRLNPYTFHVLLEWKLDTIPEKWLITGIAMKAYKRNTIKSEEEDEKVGLNFFLYTYEHEGNNFYTIENIPVYDKDNEKPIEYEEFEKFIDENNRDFVKYSQSSVRRLDSRYYEYMKKWGMYKSEWEILKIINKVEGGIGDYFEKATDNKAVFDKLILPAISENMKNYDYEENSLKDMFRSNLYITKNLPKLLKREGDYRDLIIAINPLIENADIGSKILDMKERCVADGNDLYFILKDEEKNVEKDIENWKNEIRKGKKKEEELLFERANLEYAEVNRDIKEIENQNKELETKIKEKENITDDLLKEKKLYEINKILVYKNKYELSLKEKIDEKERLIEILDLEDTKKRVEELDERIRGKWKDLKNKWGYTPINYSSYKNYLNRELEKERTNMEKVKTVEKGLQNEINKFLIKEEELEEGFKNLSNIFDPFRMNFPEKLLEDMETELKDSIDNIKKSNTEIDKKEQNINNLRILKNKVGLNIENEKDKLKDLKKQLNSIEKTEKELKRRISWELGLDDIREVMTPTWIEEKLYKIEILLEDKQKRVQKLQKDLWEKNIDKTLNRDRDCWIPNKDILDLKERIGAIGINVETGMEFLTNLKKEEIDNILKNNPSFIYGLVISNKEDWKVIEKAIDNEILIHSLVPIYLRTDMNQIGEKEYRLIYNEGYNFINSSNYIEWIDNIYIECGEIEKTIDIMKEGIRNLGQLINDIKNWTLQKNSFQIREDINEHKNNIEDLEQKERDINSKIYEEDKNLVIIKNKLKDLNEQKERLKIHIDKLEKYVERKIAVEKERITYEENLEKIRDINNKIKEIEKEIDIIKSRKGSNDIEYRKWEIEIEEKLKSIKEVVPEAKVDFNAVEDVQIINMPSYYIEGEDIFIDLEERKALAGDFEKRNSQLIVIQKDIGNFHEKIENTIEELEKIDKLWKNYKCLEMPLNEINIIIREIEKSLKSHEIEYSKLISQRDKLAGILEVKRESIIKIGNKIQKTFGIAPKLWEGVNLLQKNIDIEEELKDNKNFLNEAENILEERKEYKASLNEHIFTLKMYKEIDFHKGKMNNILKDKFIRNPREEVEGWVKRYKEIEDRLLREIEKGEEHLKVFEENVQTKVYDELLKERILNEIKKVNMDRFKRNLESFNSMKNHFQMELNTLSMDKEKAEQARNQWAIRASKRVLKIIESLKEMVAGMVYINQNGYSFPLVKLRGEERLPREEEDILYLLKEYFVEAIEKVFEGNENIEDIDDKALDGLMGDRAIFSKAIQGRYPVLMVYKMTEKNEFKYAKPRDYYYTTWEAINKGEGDLPEGSGGETVSVNTFVIMMLMNYKKRYVGNENPWTVLILDNPFGKASAKHILDPIFEIGNKLNFQIIAFAAPEIIKVEISERFPVFWELRIGDRDKDGLVTGNVIYGGRKLFIP